MSSEPLIPPSEALSTSHSFRRCGETVWIFDELPKATVVSVSRPDTGDISSILLSYTIQLQYKQAHTRILVCFFLVFISLFMYRRFWFVDFFLQFLSLWSKLLAIMPLVISWILLFFSCPMLFSEFEPERRMNFSGFVLPDDLQFGGFNFYCRFLNPIG